MKTLNLLALPAAMALALSLSACGGKNIKAPAASTSVPQAEKADTIEAEPIIQAEDGDIEAEADIRDTAAFAPQEWIKPVYFSYDKYDLSEEARETMKNNAGILNDNRQWTIVVEGYCDNRGTAEYNMSLGQKRAKAVRDYYIRLGVQPKSIGTISYGIENPVCNEATEECWSLNRRSETKVK